MAGQRSCGCSGDNENVCPEAGRSVLNGTLDSYDAAAMRMCVLKPAGLFLMERSIPMTPPQITAKTMRNNMLTVLISRKLSKKESTGNLLTMDQKIGNGYRTADSGDQLMDRMDTGKPCDGGEHS